MAKTCHMGDKALFSATDRLRVQMKVTSTSSAISASFAPISSSSVSISTAALQPACS